MSEQLAEDITPATTNTQPKAKPQKAPRSGGLLGWFNFLLILLLAGVVAGALWFGWQHHQVLLNQLSYLMSQQQQQSLQEKNLWQSIDELKKQNSALVSKNQALAQQIDQNAERIAQLAGADQQDWLVAEAEYLLRLANQRLQLERDWGSALAMLQAADKVLAETGNPRLNPVRALVANEIMAVRQAPALDIAGAVLRLQSVQNLIPTLPWLPSKLVQADNAAVEADSPNLPWYERFWNKLSHSLVRLVRIRERSTAMDAPLTPDQQFYLQQNMYLMLEQAQVAVLREEDGLYQQSLERVSDWVQRYLLTEDAQTQAVQQSLKELQQWQVAPQRPDISASLVRLQQMIEQSRRGGVVGGEQ